MAPKRKSSAAAKTTAKKKNNRSLSEVKTLGTQLLTSRSHINSLPILLTYVTPTTPPNFLYQSLLSLQSFFSSHLPSLPSSSKTPLSSDPAAATAGDPEVIFRTWLRTKFDELAVSLLEILVSPQCEETIKELVLDTIMEFVKLGSGGKFYSALYRKLILALISSSVDVEFLIESLAMKYFKYIDVCYFTFISVEKLCGTLSKNNSGDKSVDGGDDSKASLDSSIKKIQFVLSLIPAVGDLNADSVTWSAGFLSEGGDSQEDTVQNKEKHDKKQKVKSTKKSSGNVSKKMKVKFTKAWMSFLRLPLPVEVYKEVLVNLHQAVIPYLSNPAMLCDFLTRSYDVGGVVSVMALSGLFVLMTKHGLEYPDFYEKLYAIINTSIFMAKHRAKFFELLDACLKSPLLPAYLAAAFTKKLSRLSLIVPPSGSLVIIALVHNLLRRHPSINFLVHKDMTETTNQEERSAQESVSDGNADVTNNVAGDKQGIDFFDDEESDPLKSNAMKSSLWEIDTLRHHYCPPVSRFILSLENDLTVRSKTTEVAVGDFSSGSYATIFSEEMRRRVKQVPLAFYKATPTSLFSESDFPGWTFKGDGGTVL